MYIIARSVLARGSRARRLLSWSAAALLVAAAGVGATMPSDAEAALMDCIETELVDTGVPCSLKGMRDVTGTTHLLTTRVYTLTSKTGECYGNLLSERTSEVCL